MSNLRKLTIAAGAVALMALAGTAAAQLGADGLPPTQAQIDKSQALRLQNQGSQDSVVRPASAMPPERIQADRADEPSTPATRPVVPARDDPRSVEETQDRPAPADR